MSYDEDEDPEFDEMSDAAALDSEAEVSCPYCGEVVSVAVDAGGGSVQDYVEDCPVCCRPWRVHVHLQRGGAPQVHLETQDDEE
jgi:hypothetical protein